MKINNLTSFSKIVKGVLTICFILPRIIVAEQGDDLLLFIPPMIAAANKNKQLTADLCQGYRLNDKQNRPMTKLTKPDPGQHYIDPVFDSKITRITDSNLTSSGVIKTLYNTIQAWNADESRLILWHRGDGHHLYDGQTYQRIQRLAIAPTDIEEVFWNPTNPNLLIYPNAGAGQVVSTSSGTVTLSGNELIEYNVENQQYRIIKNFNNNCSSSLITGGGDVQMMSAKGDVIGLRLRRCWL